MTVNSYAVVVSGVYLLASSLSHANCSSTFHEQYASAQRIVDSLTPDKPGQTRVFAADGAEYRAGEALWMKGLIRAALRACVQSDETRAAADLREVLDLLRTHHHAT